MQGGKVYVSGSMIGRDQIVINVPIWIGILPLAAAALIVGLVFWISPSQPRPKMGGDFNVAVAEFGVVDAQGKPVDSPDGRTLAEQMYRRLDDELKILHTGAETSTPDFVVEVWGPSQVRRVTGTLASDRAGDAQRLATDLNADIVIYGDVVLDLYKSSFAPQFYISNRQLRNAEELTGSHPAGEPIQVADNITKNLVVKDQLRARLLSQTGILAQFVVGLGHYALGQFQPAAAVFQQALGAAPPGDRETEKILALFAGKTAHELAALQSSPDDKLKYWNQAQDYYRRVLELDGEYSRAWLGYADTGFQKARGNCEPGKVDVTGLGQAIDGYQKALTAREQPPLAEIGTKVSFYLGRAYLCQSLAQVENRWEDAERADRAVVAEFERRTSQPDKERLRDLAADAHADLGLNYWTRPAPDLARAAGEYRLALQVNQPSVDLGRRRERQAIFYNMIAEICEGSRDYSQADKAWDQAVLLDPREPSPIISTRETFRQRRANPPGPMATPTK